MPPTLADALDVVLPDLPPVLVPAESLGPLRDLASGLAPVTRCGFEVRLGASPEVDFQQGVVARGGEREALAAHLSENGLDAGPCGSVAALLEGWSDPSSPLHGALEELWLEFDRPPVSSLSVFAGLARESLAAPERAAAAEAALDLLIGRPSWAPWRPAIERCIAACSGGAFVSHLGVMVGRASPFVRMNVKRLEPAALDAYLRGVGWAGDGDHAAALLRRLRARADAVTVCLDVDDRVQARIGFECHLTVQPPAEPGWAALLDDLVAEGWCTQAKRDGLLGWPGLVVPGPGGPPWPPQHVRDALLRPGDQFTSIERQLSHVKVTLEPGGEVGAKGYFGFLHAWLRPGAERTETAPATVPVGRAAPRDDGARVAAEAGIEFLLGARTGAGWWREFSGRVDAQEDWSRAFGESDAWVTAYVATALAGTGDARARAAALEAWGLLCERRLPGGGWSYNRNAPVDADSTAWGLRLAAALGTGGSAAAAEAREALARHELPGGGVATYREEVCPRPRPSSLVPPGGSVAGWCATAHPCVTAAAAPVATSGEGLLESLRRSQWADGSWRAYWWEDPGYATALAADALARDAAAGDEQRLEAAARWALHRIGPDGSGARSPFATAWCVRILALAGAAGREVAIDRLLRTQEPDGGWPSSALLLAPRPDVTDPWAPGAPGIATPDRSRIFTTATVLAALTAP